MLTISMLICLNIYLFTITEEVVDYQDQNDDDEEGVSLRHSRESETLKMSIMGTLDEVG